jgi:nucleoside 2-deoxyribosyltransferase
MRYRQKQPSFVFLSIPMDGLTVSEIRWRERRMQKVLGSLSVDSRSAYDEENEARDEGLGPRERAAVVVARDVAMLKRADVVLIDFSKVDHAYVGCTCEMVYAHLSKKPVIAYVGSTGIRNRTWLIHHADTVCGTLREIPDAVRSALRRAAVSPRSH